MNAAELKEFAAAHDPPVDLSDVKGKPAVRKAIIAAGSIEVANAEVLGG